VIFFPIFRPIDIARKPLLLRYFTGPLISQTAVVVV